MKNNKPHYDHPNTLENDEATVLWILAMVFVPAINEGFISLVFMWILLTVCWYKHITRHERS